MKFRVTYASGVKTEYEVSDCETVEEFCNTHFGSAWEVAEENGATVVIVDEEAETQAQAEQEADDEDKDVGEQTQQEQ